MTQRSKWEKKVDKKIEEWSMRGLGMEQREAGVTEWVYKAQTSIYSFHVHTSTTNKHTRFSPDDGSKSNMFEHR